MSAADHHALVTRTARPSLAHDLIRQIVVAAMTPSLRRRIHRRLGRWLEQSADGDDQVLLEALEHRRAGGEQALGLALTLARSPRRRLLAGAGLRRLIEIGAGADPRQPEVLDLEFELASLCVELGEHDEAFRLWSQRSRLMPDSTAGAIASVTPLGPRCGRADGKTHGGSWISPVSRASDPVLEVEVLALEAGLQSNLERQSDAARVTAAVRLTLLALAGAALGPANLDGRARRPTWRPHLRALTPPGWEMIPLRCSPSPRRSRHPQPVWTTPLRRLPSCRAQWPFASWAGTVKRRFGCLTRGTGRDGACCPRQCWRSAPP